jgi:UDP-N-acetylglucosamine 1-carboxyvinyltransferase
MAKLIVRGGGKLSGTVTPSGNKNAVLPIIPATLLTDEVVTLTNVPEITDVEKFVEFFTKWGSRVDWDRKDRTLQVDHSSFDPALFDGKLPEGMRAAIMLLPGLIHRVGKVSVETKVGGCELGLREIDPHLHILQALGVDVDYSNGSIKVSAAKGFTAGSYWADYMSVTTTENFIMAASVAKGTSVLMNAASEPHVQDVCHFLQLLGAKISGIGSSRLEIEGVDVLKGGEHRIISDHHEIATFLALGAMTGGRIEVEDSVPEHLGLITRSFEKFGVTVTHEGNMSIVEENQKLTIQEPFTKNMVPRLEIAPWPYFPTDVSPVMMALATKARGEIMIWNKMYEGAMIWVNKLQDFGVKLLTCDPHRVLIWGGRPLHPADVEAPYIIRAAVALFMVAQSIEGESTISNAESIQRAHPLFVERLNELGADVKWEED